MAPGALAMLQVDEEFYGRGLGMLVTKALSKQIAEFKQDITACVFAHNVHSLAIFKKLGFKVVDTVYSIGTLPATEWFNEQLGIEYWIKNVLSTDGNDELVYSSLHFYQETYKRLSERLSGDAYVVAENDFISVSEILFCLMIWTRADAYLTLNSELAKAQTTSSSAVVPMS